MRCLSSFEVEDYFNSIPQTVTNDTLVVVQGEWAHLLSQTLSLHVSFN